MICLKRFEISNRCRYLYTYLNTTLLDYVLLNVEDKMVRRLQWARINLKFSNEWWAAQQDLLSQQTNFTASHASLYNILSIYTRVKRGLQNYITIFAYLFHLVPSQANRAYKKKHPKEGSNTCFILLS